MNEIINSTHTSSKEDDVESNYDIILTTDRLNQFLVPLDSPRRVSVQTKSDDQSTFRLDITGQFDEATALFYRFYIFFQNLSI